MAELEAAFLKLPLSDKDRKSQEFEEFSRLIPSANDVTDNLQAQVWVQKCLCSALSTIRVILALRAGDLSVWQRGGSRAIELSKFRHFGESWDAMRTLQSGRYWTFERDNQGKAPPLQGQELCVEELAWQRFLKLEERKRRLGLSPRKPGRPKGSGKKMGDDTLLEAMIAAQAVDPTLSDLAAARRFANKADANSEAAAVDRLRVKLRTTRLEKGS